MKKPTKAARTERRRTLGHVLHVAELDLTGLTLPGGAKLTRNVAAARDKACAVIADPLSTPAQRKQANDIIKRAGR